MAAELLFESRLTYHVLRQDGDGESAPCLSLQLALVVAPMIYASDGTVVNGTEWSMKIRRGTPSGQVVQVSGSMQYKALDGASRCLIDMSVSPERFTALLEMFRGGHASEITVLVGELADKPDYSKHWNTALYPRIVVQSICFEFPLPQSEA